MKMHSTQWQDVRADLQEVQDRIQKIEADLESLVGPNGSSNGDSHGSSHLDLVRINESLNELGAQRSQEDILSAYLRSSAAYFDRGVLFLRKDSKFVPWRAVGYDSADIGDLDSKNTVIDAAESRTLVSEHKALREKFPWASEEAGHSICLPLVFEDSVPVVLYADSDGEVDRDSLELMSQLTVLVLKNHYLSYLSLKPSSIGEVQVSGLRTFSNKGDSSEEVALGNPSETEGNWSDLRVTDPDWEAHKESSEDDSGPVMTGIPPFDSDLEGENDSVDETAVKTSAADSSVILPGPSLEQDAEPDESFGISDAFEEPAGEDGLDREATAEITAEETLEEPESLEAHEDLSQAEEPDTGGKPGLVWADSDQSSEDEDAETDTSSESWELSAEEETGDETEGSWLEDRLRPVESDDASTEEQKASSADSGESPAGVTTEDSREEAPHAEARRFARLLVSEIKLYNVEAIEQGLKENDLYSRLQRDIDRSREMYEKRVHPSVRQETDYFHEEVLRILAAENAEAMGSGYPGPQIEG